MERLLRRQILAMGKEDEGRSSVPICEARYSNCRKPPHREVTLTSLQLLLNKMAGDGYRKSTVEKVRTHTRACFEYAMDEDLMEKSPMRKLVMPNIRKKSSERYLSVDELRAPLSHAAPREHLILRILAVCGLRPAEILFLRIEDFEGTQLRIDEALKERQKGEDRIGETKTAESDNYVPVPPDLAREIATWIGEHPDRGTPRAFLFPNSGGAFGVGNYLKRHLKPLAEKPTFKTSHSRHSADLLRRTSRATVPSRTCSGTFDIRTRRLH